MTKMFPGLGAAIRHALSDASEAAELSSEQAVEFLERFRGSLPQQRVMLMHEIIDCGCSDEDCQACNGKGIEFTEVWEDDLREDESAGEYVSGFVHWQVWARG